MARSDVCVWREAIFDTGNTVKENSNNFLTTQISQVDNCALKKVGTLPFQHQFGGCAAVGDKFIALCFDDSRTQDCRTSDNLQEWK